MKKRNRPQGTTSKKYPVRGRGENIWRCMRTSGDGVHNLCGFFHYHKYIMPAGLGKAGQEYSIMLTGEIDKPIVFLHQDGKGYFSVVAVKNTLEFAVLTDYGKAEKEFKRNQEYKEY